MAVASIVFACVLGSALLGMAVRVALPETHLSAESRDAIKLVMGLIVMMTAFVLGLVTASAKSSYDAEDAAIKRSAGEILTVDRLLARYGPETAQIRDQLKRTVALRLEVIWPKDRSQRARMDTTEAISTPEGIEDRIQALSPRSEAQRWLQAKALEKTSSILNTRWLVFGGADNPVPLPFLVILVAWLSIIFAIFGMLGPRNATVLAGLFVCALSVSSALLLIVEMGTAFDGLIKVSSAPLRYTLAHLGQ
jgi:hypothetical protein